LKAQACLPLYFAVLSILAPVVIGHLDGDGLTSDFQGDEWH